MRQPVGGGGPLAALRTQLGMSQTQLAMESGASIHAVQAAERGLAKEIAEPILDWAEILGLNSLDLSRRYQDWRAAFCGDATELLDRVFEGRRAHLVFRRLQHEPPGVVFRSYRRLAGISVAEVARALGVELQIYEGWEKGRNAPQVSRALTETGWISAAPFAKAVPKPPRPTRNTERTEVPALSEPISLRCDLHGVVAHPGVFPAIPCKTGARYQAASEDGVVKGNLTPCAIRAANDAHFASSYTGKGFRVTEA